MGGEGPTEKRGNWENKAEDIRDFRDGNEAIANEYGVRKKGPIEEHGVWGRMDGRECLSEDICKGGTKSSYGMRKAEC